MFRTAKLRNIGEVFKRTLKTLAIVLTLIAAIAYSAVSIAERAVLARVAPEQLSW